MRWIWKILVAIWNALKPKVNSYVATVEADDQGVAIAGAVMKMGIHEAETGGDGRAVIHFRSKAGVTMGYTVSAAGYESVAGKLVTG